MMRSAEKSDKNINILFMHYDLHFYRIPIYNKLSDELIKKNINLIIWPQKILGNKKNIKFNFIEDEYNFKNFKKILKEKKITGLINFLQPSNPSINFYLKMIFFAYVNKIDLFYYGHGVNLSSSSKVSTFVYNILHTVYKQIILYTPNEKKYLWRIHHKKINIAYNTLDLSNRKFLIRDSKKNIRKKYNLKDEFIILFSGRIEKRKKLDILLDFIAENYDKNFKLIVVGPTKDSNLIEYMQKLKNVVYMGAIYDEKEIAEIFFMSDIFSIPGHIGLGLIEAFYWGLPVITLDVKHAPEIYYLQNKKNGFILENKKKLNDKLVELSLNKKIVLELSKNAKQTYLNKANVQYMINGIIKALVK